MLGISGIRLSVVPGDSATRKVKVWMTLCSVILFLTDTDLCDFMHRLLLVEWHDLYRLRRVALLLGTTER